MDEIERAWFQRGKEEGVRQARRQSLDVVAALVTMAGGEVRIPENLLVAQDPMGLVREDDPVSGEVVLKVY